MQCLYHGIQKKQHIVDTYNTQHEWLSYGVPVMLVADNGREFRGKDLADACEDLEIHLEHTPVRTPELKPHVERFFETLNNLLFHISPGTTFSNIFDRGEYDSKQQACVYVSQIARALHIVFLDDYAERFHKGIKAIPARRWEAATAGGWRPRLPRSRHQLDVLLSRSAMRSVRAGGIEFENLRYNAAELGKLRVKLGKEQVKIKYNPADLSYIHVLDPFEQRYIRVPALDLAYTRDLSLWKHRIIQKVARQEQDKPDTVGLAKARRALQDLIDSGRNRRMMGRWNTNGNSMLGESVPEQSSGQSLDETGDAYRDGPIPSQIEEIMRQNTLRADEWLSE